jgi:hypothetical protein
MENTCADHSYNVYSFILPLLGYGENNYSVKTVCMGIVTAAVFITIIVLSSLL